MQKLLATGRTDLLTRFISKKGRPFKAFLAKTADGRVGFEFEARAPRKTEAREPAAATYAERQRSPAAPAAAAKRSKAPAKPARTTATKATPKPKRKAA